MSLGYLVLEDGSVFPGVWNSSPALAHKAIKERAGEVVFNTSHSGYEEIATDPSYFSQIVVMTAPMQGNYGVDKKFWESRKIWIEGFICLQLQKSNRDHSWLARLHENETPCLSEVDTRALTLKLREGGTPWGAIVEANSETEAKEKAKLLIVEKKKIDMDWVFAVSRTEIEERTGKKESGPIVGVLDFGCKENILRELELRCSKVIIFPSRTNVDKLNQYALDGILLSNGPGNPAAVQVATETVRELLKLKSEKKKQLPIFGICMGHQILSLALGAKTYKLKFGHRGANHPIRDELLKKTYVTSQNHGYAVDAKTLPTHAQVTQTNLNDQTVAGIWSETLDCLGIQYHPESHPGPHDADGLFDFFVNKMIRSQK